MDWVKNKFTKKRASTSPSQHGATGEPARASNQGAAFVPSDPSLPLPPKELLALRDRSAKRIISNSRYTKSDTPLAALYRMYEYAVLDQHIGLRNELEFFWYRPWSVSSIPDPKDTDSPERYAVLACIPALLVEAFNERNDHGLRRGAPAIMSSEEMDEYQASPKVYETVPEWTTQVPPLPEVLSLPHVMEGKTQLVDMDDDRASPPFKEKNILTWHPHIHFI